MTAFLGATVHDPDAMYSGRVVAVFESYRAALKWGAWDHEYIPPGDRPARWQEQRFALVYTGRDAMLLAAADVRLGSLLHMPAEEAVLDPALVRKDAPLEPLPHSRRRSKLAVPEVVEMERAQTAARKKRKSAILRRKPVLGVGC